jgi:hypothetical protein
MEAAHGARPRSATDERRSQDYRERIGMTLFWLTILVYAYFVPEYFSWNTESHLYPAFSFVDHGTFQIDRYQQYLGDKAYWHGHYYSDKAPGLTFLAIPVYAVLHVMLGNQPGYGYIHSRTIEYYISFDMIRLRYGITFLLVILPSAGLVWLLWLFLTHLTSSAGWSLIVTAVYAFGTTAFLYSDWFFSHQITAVLLFASFLLLYWHVRYKPPNRRMYLLSACAGLLAGYSVISEFPTAIIAALLGIYLLVVARSRLRTLLAFAAGMIPPAALAIYYNIAAFGAPFATGYMHVHSEFYHSNIHGGIGGITNPLNYGIQIPTWNVIWQLTLGTYRGLFFICPVLLLFVPGVIVMWRRRSLRPELWLCVAIVVIYLIVDASRGVDQNGWSGGASVTSRHLVPMLPFMVIPIAVGLRNRPFRNAFLALGAVSMAIMFIVVSQTSFFTQTDQNLLANEAIPHFFANYIGPSWTTIWWASWGFTGWVSLLPLAAAVLLFVGRLSWLFTQWPQTQRPASAPGIVAQSVIRRVDGSSTSIGPAPGGRPPV